MVTPDDDPDAALATPIQTLSPPSLPTRRRTPHHPRIRRISPPVATRLGAMKGAPSSSLAGCPVNSFALASRRSARASRAPRWSRSCAPRPTASRRPILNLACPAASSGNSSPIPRNSYWKTRIVREQLTRIGHFADPQCVRRSACQKARTSGPIAPSRSSRLARMARLASGALAAMT